MLERPVLQQPREQQVAHLEQRQVLLVVHLTGGQQPGRLEVQQRGGDDEERGGLVELELPADGLGVGDEVVGHLMQRHLGDVEAVREDQLQQQIERPLEIAQPDLEAALLGLTPVWVWLCSRAEPVDDLARQRPICLCATGFRRPRGDRLAGDAGLGEAHGAGDDGVEHQVAEPLQHPGHHLAGVDGARVVSGDQDAADGQLRVQPVVHLLDGVGQQRQPAQREVLALGRDDHAVAARQPVDGEQTQRRLAVDQHVVVAVQHRVQRAGQRLLAAHLVDQLDLGGRQVDVARHQVHALDAGVDQHVVDRHPRLDQQVVHRVVELVVRHAQPRGQRTLRVEVHQQHPAAVLGEAGAQIDGRRRLADAALLVAHRDDLGRAVHALRLGLGNGPRRGGRSGPVRRRPLRRSCPTVAGQAPDRHAEHPGKFNGAHLPGLADPRATWIPIDLCAGIGWRTWASGAIAVIRAPVCQPVRRQSASSLHGLANQEEPASSRVPSPGSTPRSRKPSAAETPAGPAPITTTSCSLISASNDPRRPPVQRARGCAPAHTSRSAFTVTSV